jgi:hypothetical protein
MEAVFMALTGRSVEEDEDEDSQNSENRENRGDGDPAPIMEGASR